MRFSLTDDAFRLPLDSLFLEEDPLLEAVHFGVGFVEPTLCHSKYQTAITNRALMISLRNLMDTRALIPHIAPRKVHVRKPV